GPAYRRGPVACASGAERGGRRRAAESAGDQSARSGSCGRPDLVRPLVRRLSSWPFGLITAILIAVVWAASPAGAHLTPNSEISLDMGHSLVAAEVVAPLAEIAYARGGGAAAERLTAAALTGDLLA